MENLNYKRNSMIILYKIRDKLTVATVNAVVFSRTAVIAYLTRNIEQSVSLNRNKTSFFRGDIEECHGIERISSNSVRYPWRSK